MHFLTRKSPDWLQQLFCSTDLCDNCYIFHIPFGVNDGYIHIGDSLIYLAAAFLPTPYAMFAGAIGGAMADILTAPVYAPATFIIKMLISLPITCKKDKIVNVHNCVGVVVAAVISFIGYYITDVILFGTWGALIPSIVGTLPSQAEVLWSLSFLVPLLTKAGFKSTMKNKFGI